jgi:putative acetyltransferase
MHANTPPESVHALDLDALRSPEITFWSMWKSDELVGCGALKKLDSRSGKIKSMRTAKTHRRHGIARKMLEHIIGEAQSRGYDCLLLETGSGPEFAPARALYASFGF